MVFRDRSDAGRRLAARLQKYAHHPQAIVVALPRGGVPVGYEVAKKLHLPLDVFLVRKLGVPGREELALGALASGGERVLNHEVVEALNIPEEVIDAIAAREQRHLQWRERAYRDDRPPLQVTDQVVILIDDGLATGATMQAAVLALRQQHPAKIVVAVPVGAPESCANLQAVADEVVCLEMPEPFAAVGQWYEDFSQTTDEEVQQLLQPAALAKQTGT